MQEEKIFYKSTDGVTLCGLLSKINSSGTIIILCHGIRGVKDECGSFVALTERLQQEGYNSFRFDFRGHGESGGAGRDMTIAGEIADVEHTMDMLRGRGFSTFILLGGSFGASIISQLNYEKHRDILGLICWYGALDYTKIYDETLFSEANKQTAERDGYFVSCNGFQLGLSLLKEVEKTVPYECLAKVSLPVLLIHGKEDKMVPCEVSEIAYPLCKQAKLELIDGGDHAFTNSQKALEDAIDKTVAFIKTLI